jgi:hypothetical protein
MPATPQAGGEPCKSHGAPRQLTRTGLIESKINDDDQEHALED